MEYIFKHMEIYNHDSTARVWFTKVNLDFELLVMHWQYCRNSLRHQLIALVKVDKSLFNNYGFRDFAVDYKFNNI